jgi:hypothetical protein
MRDVLWMLGMRAKGKIRTWGREVYGTFSVDDVVSGTPWTIVRRAVDNPAMMSADIYALIEDAELDRPALEALAHCYADLLRQEACGMVEKDLCGPAPFPVGERNSALYKHAGLLKLGGLLSDEEICKHVRAANLERCNPPLGEAEVDELLASVLGKALPVETEEAPPAEPPKPVLRNGSVPWGDRISYLFQYAHRLRKEGLLDPESIVIKVRAANVERYDPPLDDAEVDTIMEEVGVLRKPIFPKIPRGRRNSTLLRYARGVYSTGMLDAEGLALSVHVLNSEWCDPPLGEAEVDELLASVLGGGQPVETAEAPPAEAPPAEPPKPVLRNGSALYGDRYTYLFQYARRLHKEALLAPELVVAKVYAANAEWCSPPLSEAEVDAILASALRDGQISETCCRSAGRRASLAEKIPRGERRNTLHNHAKLLKLEGLLSAGEISIRVWAANRALCKPPLEDAEVDEILKAVHQG